MSDFSLKDMVKFIIKHVKLIVICALIITVVGCVYVNICQTYKASIMIEYDYYGIEEGKNPLGGKLNVYEIMSPTVVENAIKSLGLRENVDEIRNSITITPVVDDKTSEKIKATSEKGEDYEFFPSTYAITYDYPAAYGSDHGKFVLNKILQAYDELFIRNYTGTKTLPDVLNTVDYSGYDYLEVCDLIYNQIDNAKNFLGVMDKEDYSFRSANTGMTFSDLFSAFHNLENNEYARLYANVLAGLLTKDKEALIKKYKYKIENLDIESIKKDKESALSFNILDDFYKRYKEYKQIDVHDIPERQRAYDEIIKGSNINEFYTTYDEILINYVDSGVAAMNARHDIDYYSYVVEAFQNDNVPQEYKQYLTDVVNELIEQIESKMASLISATNITINDYYRYKGNNYINHLSFVDATEKLPVKTYILFSIFAGLGFGIIIAVFIETLPEVFTKKESTEIFQSKHIPMLSFDRKRALSEVGRYLDGAIEKKFEEFLLYFQPIVDAKGIWTDAEGLIRWESNDLGLVMPSEFIHIAQQENLIEPLGEWVFEEACKQCKRWNDSGYPNLGVSVNLSVMEFKSANFIDNICRILRETGVNPENISVELSNGEDIWDMNALAQKLSVLKALGMSVALDNFGTKYTSINILHELPLDIVKIDARFSTGIQDDKNYKEHIDYIENIIKLAHDLNIKVCVKGIETEQQMNDMLNIGVDYMQGYFFARPISADQFEIIYRHKNSIQVNAE